MTMNRKEFFNGELTKEKREMIINEVLEHHINSLDLTYFFNASQLSEYDYRYFTIDEKANEVTYKYTYDITRLVTNVLMHQTQYNDDLVKDDKDVDLVVLLACLDLDNINDICLFSDGDLEALERMHIIEVDEEEPIQLEEFEEYLENMNDDDLLELWNEYIERNNCYDDRVYNMFELDDELSNRTPSEIIDMVVYGDFNGSHNCFKYDGYGNLESFANVSDAIECDELTKYIVENREDYEELIEKFYLEYER